MLHSIGRYLLYPQSEIALNRKMGHLSKRTHFVKDIHAPEVMAQVRTLAPDLGLIYGSPILKPDLFEMPALGTLGIHHGKAPQYRGNKTTFWAMYNSEKTAGVIIQKINAGLDTGLIIKEGEVVIGRRSQRRVWKELEALGLDIYIQAILDVKNGTAVYRPQLGPKGKLYKNPKFLDLLNFQARQLKRWLSRSEHI
jgi:methionyl-tRNA formyltransferase